MRALISAIAILLVFVAYAPYLRDTIKGKTKPHIYTWIVWGYVPLIIFGLQISDGGGWGSYVTLSAALICFVVVAAGIKRGDHDITKVDNAFLISALVATGLWLIADQPIVSVTLLSAIEMLGFAPTIRKSWNKPEEETLFTWGLNAFRHGLSIFGLEAFTYITLVFPVTWTFANLAFAIMLIYRKRSLSQR